MKIQATGFVKAVTGRAKGELPPQITRKSFAWAEFFSALQNQLSRTLNIRKCF